MSPQPQYLNDTATISWNAVSGATSYVVFTNNPVGASCSSGCPLGGTQLGPAANSASFTAGSFWVSVKACNSAGCSGFSPATTFTILPAKVTVSYTINSQPAVLGVADVWIEPEARSYVDRVYHPERDRGCPAGFTQKILSGINNNANFNAIAACVKPRNTVAEQGVTDVRVVNGACTSGFTLSAFGPREMFGVPVNTCLRYGTSGVVADVEQQGGGSGGGLPCSPGFVDVYNQASVLGNGMRTCVRPASAACAPVTGTVQVACDDTIRNTPGGQTNPIPRAPDGCAYTSSTYGLQGGQQIPTSSSLPAGGDSQVTVLFPPNQDGSYQLSRTGPSTCGVPLHQKVTLVVNVKDAVTNQGIGGGMLFLRRPEDTSETQIAGIVTNSSGHYDSDQVDIGPVPTPVPGTVTARASTNAYNFSEGQSNVYLAPGARTNLDFSLTRPTGAISVNNSSPRAGEPITISWTTQFVDQAATGNISGTSISGPSGSFTTPAPSGATIYSGTLTNPPTGATGGGRYAGGQANLTPVTVQPIPAPTTPTTHLECVSNTCTQVSGAGANTCAPAGGACTRSGPGPGGSQPGTVNLTVSKGGNGAGAVNGSGIDCGTDCSEPYPRGTSVTLTATAASGSQFSGWDVTGCSGSSCTVTMDASKTVTASFSASGPTGPGGPGGGGPPPGGGAPPGGPPGGGPGGAPPGGAPPGGGPSPSPSPSPTPTTGFTQPDWLEVSPED